MNKEIPTPFETPFDSDEILPPFNDIWEKRRAVNKKLRQLALQLVTKDSSLEKLTDLDNRLEQALDILAEDKDLLGRKSWIEDEVDHGSYRIISREITPIAGNSNALAPPLHVWFDREQQKSRAKVRLNWLYEGPPQCVHGGVVAALFDEFLGCTQLLSGKAGATASLSLHYHRPTPLNTDLQFEGEVKSVRGRKLVVSGELYAGGKLTVSAEGLFVTLEEGVMNLADRVKGR